MSDSAEAFLTQLHRDQLKALGFGKKRHTFSRACDGYTERFQVQGSAWNDATHPWRFYVNVGVEFDDVHPRSPARDFPGTHCWTRLEELVPRAPADFDLVLGQESELATDLIELLLDASGVLADQMPGIRAAYGRQPSSRLSSA
jgi:Domain of unknown function (DUF4304)